MKKLFLAASLILFFACTQQPETGVVTFVQNDVLQKIEVYVDGKLFTNYIYPDTLEKQALYPIYTASGIEVTRGYPLDPRPYERTSHGHHTGMWFNYGDVNGVNFWNNSFAVKPEDKAVHGTIKLREITRQDATKGELVVVADWVDYYGDPLIREETTYIFSGDETSRTIEHISILNALTDLTFTEDVEGLLGMRMDRVFEEPTTTPIQYVGEDGLPSDSLFIYNDGVNGKYRNQQGDVGADVWGKRSPWVALRGVKDGELITVAVIDNQSNFGYPAWSHARGYGMFSTNNFGAKVFDETIEPVRLQLKKGESITFKHKIIFAGELTDEYLNEVAKAYN